MFLFAYVFIICLHFYYLFITEVTWVVTVSLFMHLVHKDTAPPKSQNTAPLCPSAPYDHPSPHL